MSFPRIVIAGVHSGAGKTTFCLGLMKALQNRGLKVQPYKVGPDYIDSGLHYHACGRKSHNLDSWMGSQEVVKEVFAKNARQADISIIEGVMGLYDGANSSRLAGSTAEMAIILKAPVILVIDVQGMAQSCMALIKGYMDYEPTLDLCGVVLNNASEYHETILKKSIEEELGVQVLACLPRQEGITMPSRHLGLLPAEENRQLQAMIVQMGEFIARRADLDTIIKLARVSDELDLEGISALSSAVYQQNTGRPIRIGIANDEAFSFYYQDSLDYLQELGAQMVPFSPLRDKCLPAVEGLYLGGGFPEMFLPQLSGNQSMINAIREAHRQNMPIYAECGGFLYLCTSIADFDGQTWEGAGLIPARACLEKRLQGLGYVEASVLQDTILANQGDCLRGHEFHYSRISGLNPEHHAYRLYGGKGEEGRPDGYIQGNLLASYVHLHLRSTPAAAIHFLEECRRYVHSDEKEVKQ